ncbi:MAG TPA: sterol desaturase family protein [Candidatus Dormibacteraeota bacterium]|nr:sterol desaturase family protein [Candidatus Dormibacteraeota bacterium]
MSDAARAEGRPAGLPERYGDAGAVTLRSWFRLLLRHPGPRIVAAGLAASVALRVVLAGWRWADLVVAVAFTLGQPFTEWNIHVGLLHFRPRAVRGRTVDLYVARKHRAHHRDPEHIELTLVAIPALLGLMGVFTVLVAAGFRDPRLTLTATTTGYALLLLYEWTHFLIHSPHVPRTRVYRALWRSHRLHHYKNEHYWFGITCTAADHVLRTAPDRRSVATSPTARTLGVEVEAAV